MVVEVARQQGKSLGKLVVDRSRICVGERRSNGSYISLSRYTVFKTSRCLWLIMACFGHLGSAKR